MALAADEERALARIEEELRRSDPRLAAKLSMFNRLTRSEAMPQRELLTAPGRLRRVSSRTGMWAARWRLYPPITPRGPRHPDTAHHRWRYQLTTILPVIVTVCALGAIVAIFSTLGRVGAGSARPAPATSCQSVTLVGCQSAAHTRPKH